MRILLGRAGTGGGGGGGTGEATQRLRQHAVMWTQWAKKKEKVEHPLLRERKTEKKKTCKGNRFTSQFRCFNK